MAVSFSAVAFCLASSLKLPSADFGLKQGQRLGLGLSYLLKAVFYSDFRVINKPAATQEALVEGCRSVRTKRALLVLARHAGHAWYARLEPRRLDLGKGKRQLCQGSKLDRECHIR